MWMVVMGKWGGWLINGWGGEGVMVMGMQGCGGDGWGLRVLWWGRSGIGGGG